MEKLKPLAPAAIIASLALILIATVLPLLAVPFTVTRILFTCGAAVYLMARLITADNAAGQPLRIRRLFRLKLWSAIFFAMAAVMMYLRNVGGQDWLAFTLAGALLLAYSVFMLRQADKQ